MKAVKQKEKFMPITITIETEQEAVCLWHRLNMRGSKVATDADVPIELVRSTEMWNTFDDAFRP